MIVKMKAKQPGHTFSRLPRPLQMLRLGRQAFLDSFGSNQIPYVSSEQAAVQGMCSYFPAMAFAKAAG